MQAPNSPSSTSSESLASSGGGSNGSPPTTLDAAAKQPLQRRSSLVISLQRGMSLINVNSHAYNNNHNNNNTNTPASTSKQEAGTGSKTVAKDKKQNPDTNWFHFAFRVMFNAPLLLAICSYVAITAVIIYVESIRESSFVDWLSSSAAGMSFISVFVGFVLVFRTQICYNRWYVERSLCLCNFDTYLVISSPLPLLLFLSKQVGRTLFMGCIDLCCDQSGTAGTTNVY